MKECAEKIIKVGFKKNPKKLFDEIESVIAEMVRDGWIMTENCMEDGLEFVHLFFERDICN